MPKELHEITKFTTGTITVPDEKDIPEDAASYSLNIDSVTEGGKLKGVPNDTFATVGGFQSGAQPEITSVICVADSSDSLNGKYFDIYGAGGKTEVWIDTDNSGTSAPSGSGSYAQTIEVTEIETDDTANSVAIAVAAAVDDHANFSCKVLSNEIIITDGANATRVDASAGDSGFTVSTTDQGSTGVSPITVDAHKMAMINNGGLHDIIWYDKDDNKLNSVTNLYIPSGSLAQVDLLTNTSSDDEVTMQVHNKEVHIGMGRGSADTPQWVGYVDHKQFGTAVTAIQKEDAELKAPGGFPQIYNAVTVGDIVYGIQYGGSRIYKFSATAFDSASYTEFTSTRGISLVAGASDIWVYDDNAGFGTLFKIDVSEWGTENEISQENNPTGWGGAGTDLDSNFEISDIHHDSVGDVIWFAAYKSGNIDYTSNWLYNTASEPSSSGAIAVTKRTPNIEGDAALGVGEWTTGDVAINLYKQCLVQTTTGVGAMCFMVADKNLWVNKDNPPAPDAYATFEDGLIMFNVEKDYPDKGDIAISVSGDTDECQPHEIKNGGSATDYGGTSYFGGFGDIAGDGRIIISKKNAANDSEFFAFDDVAHSTIGSGAQGVPTARGGSDSDLSAAIDANGMAFAVPADRDDIYTFEQYGGGGYITLSYNDSAFSSINYRERSDLRVDFTDSGTGVFRSDDTYFWKFSFMYDGYQESPLSASFTHTPGDNTSNIELDISLFNTSGLPKRVSHLVAYRAEDSTVAGSANPTTFYRFLKKMPLDPSFTIAEDVWAGTVDARRKIFVDQLNNQGASYEARTLMPETLENSIVNYALSTQINSMHVVGKCYKTEIADAMNYLFKSKVNNFDQFDWTTDFLRLPTVPTALASFNGRIYAFDENNTYRINPQGFYVEDTFEGAGCFGSDAVVVTEYGMCYCDKNNIYLHDGKSPKPIASSILTGDSLHSWHKIHSTFIPKVMFDAKRKSFMIFFKRTTGNYYAWAYNIIQNRWDLIKYGSNEPEGILHGKNGEMLVSSNGNLVHFLGSSSSTLDSWEWESKFITLGQDTVKKKFYDINVINGGTAPNVLYGVDAAAADQDPTSESGTSNYKGKVQSTHSKSKSIKIKLTQGGGTSTEKVDSVGILYRRLPPTTGNI